MERVSSAPPPLLPAHTAADLGDMQGMDFPMYVYKSRRGMKRGEESKETYKLPHRLIEKKRRDRINECIAQLKDLLPEHLKLTTLGHLEKAVVLELTLKHVKALTSLLEQQQQKILALQNGMQLDPAPAAVGQQKAEELFRSGFHMCAKEMLQYVAGWETEGDLTPANMINHLHQLATEVLQGPPRSPPPAPAPSPRPQDAPAALQPHHQGAQKGVADGLPPPPGEGYGRNCVPVIQRAYPPGGSEQSGSDTDTDSGYGGELEKRPDYYLQEAGPLKRPAAERHGPAFIKQEGGGGGSGGGGSGGGGGGGGPHRKRPRVESSEDESLSGAESSSSSSSSSRSYMSVSPHQPLPPAPHPLCMPFYLLPPSAASYLPMLEKCWYSGAMPMLYPGMGAPGDRAAAPQHHRSSRGASPSPSHPQTPMDSPALLQALKLVPPLTLETKD